MRLRQITLSILLFVSSFVDFSTLLYTFQCTISINQMCSTNKYLIIQYWIFKFLQKNWSTGRNLLIFKNGNSDRLPIFSNKLKIYFLRIARHQIPRFHLIAICIVKNQIIVHHLPFIKHWTTIKWHDLLAATKKTAEIVRNRKKLQRKN